jgi:cytochrome c oxidase subunit 4
MSSPSHEESAHVVPSATIVRIWLALVTLTVVTVVASYAELKHMAVITALLIACTKSTLVMMYFMHLRYERRVFLYFVVTAIGTYAIFVALTFADYVYR